MKRLKLIAIVICALMLGSIGVGVVMAKEDVQEPQAVGQPAVTPLKEKYQVPVKYDDKVIGRIVVNTDELTFTFTGKRLVPGTTYHIICMDAMRSIGSAPAAADGSIVVQGALDPSIVDLTSRPAFVLATSPPLQGSQALTRTTIFSSLDHQVAGYYVRLQAHVEKLDPATNTWISAPNANVTVYQTNAEPEQQVTRGWISLGQFKTNFLGTADLQAQVPTTGYYGFQAFKTSYSAEDPLAPSKSTIKWVESKHGAYWLGGAPTNTIVSFTIGAVWVTNVEGKLIDQYDKPIPGQTVELLNSETKEIIATLITDSQGGIFWAREYAFWNPPPSLSCRYNGDATHFSTIPEEVPCEESFVYE